MKKDLLINKIASEFNVDEILVSEYFDSIFETLAAAFIKNKNINISEFGRFKVKTKKDEEGEKQKTILFSPVKKFAEDINYNFSELTPVQIRLMDPGSLAAGISEEYENEDVEEILLIDFDEEKIQEKSDVFTEEAGLFIPEDTSPEIHHEEPEKQAEEILIPESEKHETPTLETEKKEEVLIPESEKHEIPTLETEKKEEILIPESEKHETPTLEAEKKEEVLISEAPPREIFSEIIPDDTKEATAKAEELIEDETIKLDEEKDRILEVLNKIKFPEKTFNYITEEIKHKEILTAAKTAVKDATIYIKEEKTEKVKTEEENIDDEIEKLKAFLTEETTQEISKPVEETEEHTAENIQSISQEEKQDIFKEETTEEQEEEISAGIASGETEKKPEDIPKSSLELEAELLQMLDERKKILEEISRLENSDLDDIVDITGPKTNGDGDKPRLHDESTLDHPKQNIFSDEEGKIFEDLLNMISGQEETGTGLPKEEEIIPEQKDEYGEKEIKEEKESGEKPEDKTYTSGTDINNLENLLGNIYEKPEDRISLPEPEEIEPRLNNLEMKVFDRLLSEPEQPAEQTPVTQEPEGEPESELTSFSDLEKMFKSFKTEITEPEPAAEIQEEKKNEKPAEEIPETTETIKTYEDISNLFVPNGEKKDEKSPDIIPEPAKKKMSPKLRLIVILGVVLTIILFFVFFYEKLVYKPSEPTKQLPVTHPVDSTKVEGSDSVIYADTNKKVEQEEADIVFEKDGKVIKETSKGFFIEFGEYENKFVLSKEIKSLKDKNITPGYEEVKAEGKTYYKIKLGPYKSLKEAKAIISKL